MFWPFKPKKKYTNKSNFNQLIESVIKEDSLKNETFEPKLDSGMAKSVCHEMTDLGILSLSYDEIDNIIDSTNIKISTELITTSTINKKQYNIANLLCFKLLNYSSAWKIQGNQFDDFIRIYLLKNDSISIVYKIGYHSDITFHFLDNKLVFKNSDSYDDEIPLLNNAKEYLRHLMNTPRYEQLVLADKFIRTEKLFDK